MSAGQHLRSLFHDKRDVWNVENSNLTLEERRYKDLGLYLRTYFNGGEVRMKKRGYLFRANFGRTVKSDSRGLRGISVLVGIA